VALLHPTAFHVEPRASDAAGEVAAAEQVVRVPDDWRPDGEAQPAQPAGTGPSEQPEASNLPLDVQLSVTDGSQYCSLTASVAASSTADGLDFKTAAGTAAALSAALRSISQALQALSLDWRFSLFVHLYVPSMAQFGAANAAYSQFLPAINPPSRVTVELAGGSELALVVEVLFARCVTHCKTLQFDMVIVWCTGV
jgi:diphthine-ammonia ligase